MGRLKRFVAVSLLLLGVLLGALLGTAAAASASTLQEVVVQSGDTLSGIGAQVDRPWLQLAAYNHLSNPNLIFVGQVIKIPSSGWAYAYVAEAPLPPTVRPVLPQPTYDYSGVWGCIANYESGGNPATNTGNGYYGAFQDTIGSWTAAGGPPGLPSDYNYVTQLAVNQRIQQQQGWGAWPVTSKLCGA